MLLCMKTIQTRVDLAREFLNSQLFDLKATRNGLHLCVLGRLPDGRYFAARLDGAKDLSNGPTMGEALPALTGLEVSYCRSFDEAEWLDDYYFHRASIGYDD